MADEKLKEPTWAYRKNAKSGEVEHKLFEDMADVPKNGGWKFNPAECLDADEKPA